MKDENYLRYDRLIEGALRSVIKKILEQVAKSGLLGNHHFYISFHTDFAGVQVPDYLRAKYPEMITIVLQYQFYDLTIDDEKFAVTVSFNNVPERLVVPFEAITAFVDPSVNFALQFETGEEEDDDKSESDDEKTGSEKTSDKGDDPPPPPKKGEVITLDSFRKKKK